ncbi:MAG: zinc-dependent alcohol dehydrogenase [Phycisphaerae bacterium]
MKQAVMTQPGRIEVRDVPAPSVGRGEVLIRVRIIGVCGSDVHVWHGTHPYTGYPVVQGHEFAGVVEQVGDGVSGIEPGRKVTALPQVVCGKCGPCRRGDWHICESLKVRGFQAPGCAQELFVAPAERVVTLPDSFSFRQGAMVEPTAVAVHALSRAGVAAGKNVVVLGAGPVGNLVGQVARGRGAEVLITDLSARRLEVARECGLERTSDASVEPLAAAVERVFGDGGFQLAFDCAGAEATITSAVQSIGKGGTVVVVAVFSKPPRVDLGLVQDRELTLAGTLMYQRRDYEQAVAAIADGSVLLEPLMSGSFRLEDYAAAYEMVDERGEEVMKLFVEV